MRSCSDRQGAKASVALTLITFLVGLAMWLDRRPNVAADSKWHVVQTLGSTPPFSTTSQYNATNTTRIPNILIAGAQKAGTTSIEAYLASHQQVCSPVRFDDEPPYYTKEVHFFDHIERFSKGLDYYRRRFLHCQDEAFVIDATPNYMLYPERVRAMYEQQGTAETIKIVMSIRNPTSREISLYNHMARDLLTSENPPSWVNAIKDEMGHIMTFDEVVEFILDNPEDNAPKSMYARQLKRWFQVFDRRQILLLSFDELKTNQTKFLQRLHDFLELPVSQPLTIPHKNQKGNKQETVMIPVSCDTQHKMSKVFQPFNADLYALLEQHPGPRSEQHPFPKFDTNCNPELQVWNTE